MPEATISEAIELTLTLAVSTVDPLVRVRRMVTVIIAITRPAASGLNLRNFLAYLPICLKPNFMEENFTLIMG